MIDYRQFLESKIVTVEKSGFDIDNAELHPGNFPHQNDAIRWALRRGRALVAVRIREEQVRYWYL
jgi:hypothetical protein